jgi:carbon-monoxide dehydrogenase medium subunit
VRAGTPEEVVGLLEEYGEAARLLMGGTDLLPGLRDGLYHSQVVVDVKHLAGMDAILFSKETGLTVGAAVTMNQLAASPEVQTHYRLLAEAARSVASHQIRNRATLGGNLCNASPCADASPAALVLEAEFLLYGPEGERIVPAREFFVGPGQTVLRSDEFMTAIRLPSPVTNGSRYLKLGRRRSGDLSLVGVAVCGFPNGRASDYGSSTDSGWRFRIGLGSVAPTVVRATEAEEFLAANPPGEETFAQAAEKAMAAASPITDVRGGADYQKAMVRTLTLRGLRDVWAQLKEVH